MASRKRQFTVNSQLRYLEKAVKMHVMQGIPVEMAIQHATQRTIAWRAGFEIYHQLRAKLKHVLEANDVAPSCRSSFYALLEELYKSGQYFTDLAISDYIDRKYPIVNEYPEIRDYILGVAGLAYVPTEQRTRSAFEKA